jgi:hypothetical protein
MATLLELRAQLVRQQADCLQLDQELNATPVGTKEYGELRNQRQKLGLAIHTTRALIKKAQTGSQSSLL